MDCASKRLALPALIASALLAAAAVTVAPRPAFADCAARCYAQENACRRNTKGDDSCSRAATRCLQGCLKR